MLGASPAGEKGWHCSCLFVPSWHEGKPGHGFSLGTALLLFFGWPQLQSWTSLCGGAGAGSRTQKMENAQAAATPHGKCLGSTEHCPVPEIPLCQEIPQPAGTTGQGHRDAGVLKWEGKQNKHGKHLCAPKICLQLNHKMLL